MERRTFLQATVVAVVLLVGLNQLVGWLGRDAVPRVVVRKAHASNGYTDVFLGNSIVQDGFSEAAWKRAAPDGSPFNAGLGWSTAAEHEVLWSEILRGGNRPKRVFYGFFDLKLHEYTNSTWWALSGNMAMGYFVDPALSAKYHAPGSPLGAAFMQAASHVPLFTERTTFWGKVEQLRRRLSAIGMKPAKPNGRTATAPAVKDEFSAFTADSSESFRDECDAVVRTNAPFHPAIDDLLASARDAGAEVCFVEMPMTEDHRRRFYDQPGWTAYKRFLRERLAARGARLIEAADWVSDGEMFKDSLHLGKTGSAVFTERLAAEMASGQK